MGRRERINEGKSMYRLFCLIFLLCVCVSAKAQSRWQGCLPSDVKPDEVIGIEQARIGSIVRQITVKQNLNQLKARCRGRKLIDQKGRQIYFYRLAGCWGNPPADYLEILERQRNELKKLKRRYTVVEISCNPTALLIQ
jgi:hypothetical protein